MNRRKVLQLAASIPALVPFVNDETAPATDACALMAAFFQAGVSDPRSHIGGLALSAAALYVEGHTDGFASVLDRGVTMIRGGAL